MKRITFTLGLLASLTISGCGKSDTPADAAAPSKPAAGVITGKVTFADGKPIDTPNVAYNITIYGVSTAGEKVNYSPAVKADGTYSQKAVPGSYRFGVLSNIEVPMGNQTLQLPLEPVGNAWNKDRDVADGIVQNYVWKITGVTPYGRENGANPNNQTHWYGVTVGMRFSGYRDDLRASTTPPPDGTTLQFSLRPLGTVSPNCRTAPPSRCCSKAKATIRSTSR